MLRLGPARWPQFQRGPQDAAATYGDFVGHVLLRQAERLRHPALDKLLVAVRVWEPERQRVRLGASRATGERGRRGGDADRIKTAAEEHRRALGSHAARDGTLEDGRELADGFFVGRSAPAGEPGSQ